MKKYNRPLAIAAAAALTLLQACGGGSDAVDQETQGFWQGTADNGRSAWGLVQPGGRYFLLISGQNGSHTLETVQRGTYASVQGARVLTSDVTTITQRQFPYTTAGNGGGSAQFQTRRSWSGTLDGATPLVSFQLNYVNDGFQSSTLSEVAGSYTSWPVAASPASTATMTVDASGAISGTYFSGCTYTGQLTSTAQPDVYDMTVNFSGTCYLLSLGPVSGMLFHDAANGRIYAAAATATTSPSWSIRGGFMFVSR